MPELSNSASIRWDLEGVELRGALRPAVGVYTRDEDLTLAQANEWETIPLLTTQESPGAVFERENGNVSVNINGFVYVSVKMRFSWTGEGNTAAAARIRATVNGVPVSWLFDAGSRERGDAETTTLDFSHPVELHEGDVVRLQARVSNTGLIIAACPDEAAVCAARLSLHVISEAP